MDKVGLEEFAIREKKIGLNRDCVIPFHENMAWNQSLIGLIHDFWQNYANDLKIIIKLMTVNYHHCIKQVRSMF